MKVKCILTLLFSIIVISSSYAANGYGTQWEVEGSYDNRSDEVSGEQDEYSFSTSDAGEWGSGWFAGMKAGAVYTMNLELGYMYELKRNPMGGMSREYLGHKKNYRFGISVGAHMFENEIVFAGNSTIYESSGYGLYGKLNFGSPVLLNFLSFAWHLKAMYTIPEDGSDHGITDARMVYGYGNDIEFWLTENACISLGFTDERDSLFGENKDDRIYPSRIRFVFGFRTFF